MSDKSLAFKNLTRKPARSVALIVLVIVLSFSILGGALIISGLKNGLSSLETRLGADIMVVPYEASTKSTLESILLSGNTGYFYMSSSVLDEVRNVEGVGEVSEQFFLATSSSSCCSLPVQIIGFNPETDFAILPWVRTAYSGDLGMNEIIVGNDLNAFVGDTLTFYGTEMKVVGKLAQSGTYLDTAVYTSNDTVKELIEAAKEKQLFDFGDVDPDTLLSSVLVNVADGYNVDEVLGNIKLKVDNIAVIRSESLVSGVSEGLNGVSTVIKGLLVAIWIFALVILIVAFVMISNERKKEFAILRVLGASKKKLSRTIMKEAFFISLIGSVIGCAVAAFTSILFGNAFQSMLDMPFLLPAGGSFAAMIIAAGVISVCAGSLSAAYSAAKISRIDTALILRGDN